MNYRRLGGIDRGALILVATMVAAFPVLFNPRVHGFDTVAYYSWLRSAVIDGDLNVRNEFEHFGYGAERGSTVTGHTHNEWAIGSAILWGPFYLAAHAISSVARDVGLGVSTDGYGPQYVWAVSLASALLACAGVLLTHRLCREHFSPQISTWATAVAWLASTLVFYMYGHPVMSHANDAFTFALLAYTWHRTRNQPGTAAPVLRGAAAGLSALVRQSNAVFVLVLVGEYMVDGLLLWRAQRGWRRSLLGSLRSTALVCLAWWIVYLPQLVTWRTVFGQWLVGNPYAGGAGGSFRWLRPRIAQVLFSTNRGLFVWTPMTLPAVVGLALLKSRAPRFSLVLLAWFLGQLYVVASWSAWSGAAAFGQRFFTNMVPAFGLGLAALLACLRKRLGFAWLAAAGCLLIAWNGVLMARYVIGDVPHTGRVGLETLFLGQLTALPRQLRRIVQAVVTRE